jgi:hypothetical protein
VSGHVRTLMRVCWHLGGLPEYGSLCLREWAHTLGYRARVANSEFAREAMNEQRWGE